MKEITFLMAIHNHQPVGNFDRVIEDAYRQAYLPFLEVLERHPGVRLALHNSGVLLDWIEAHHPDYLERLGALVTAGRVELVTGGYYEPILPSIPDEDKVDQIRKLTRFLKDRLGGDATGLWLTERVWEPSLVVPLTRAGVKYLMVDDAHFLAAGCEPESLWNCWLTEDQGEMVTVWPISKRLRYLIPFAPPEKTIEFLRDLATARPGRAALLGDDGEKFGVWPDTHQEVYGKGWLDRFFGMLEENSDWIRLALPGEETRRREPEGRVYLPTASYSEMMEWALPTPVQMIFHRFREKMGANGAEEARFVRGGFWRNFLAKYPEANLMHKRMLDVRRRVDAATGVPEAVRRAALDDVWQSQCNCAYWHGVFGGLYLPHLRDAVYGRILSAERRLDRAGNKGASFLRVERRDVDRDGHPDYRLVNGAVAALFAPGRGGALEELDLFARLRNLSHGMTRRPEAYHERLKAAALAAGSGSAEDEDAVRSIHDRVETKEPGLEKRLFFDWYRRQSLLDHFFRSDATLEQFDRGEHGEQGDFIEHPYEAELSEAEGAGSLVLRRRGHVWVGGRAVPVEVEKTVSLAAGSSDLKVEYRISQSGREAVRLWLGIEFNFTMLAGNAPDRYYTVDGVKPEKWPHLAGRGEHKGVTRVGLHDDWDRLAVLLEWNRSGDLWRLPVETISQSEAGFERIYQSSCVVPQWRIDLDPGVPWSLGLRLTVEAVE